MPEEPDNIIPEIGFSENKDHMGHSGIGIMADFDGIKIKTLRKGSKKKC